MRSRIGILVAGLLILDGLLAPAPASAGPESDIPGVPLPGPVVAGQLGGPIYDVVYRIEVPAGHVLRASLTGDPGTDFDLYLFDSTATTVLSNQGLLAKSTGPASTELVVYPSLAAATYYLDLNGATDVQGAYTLTVQFVADQSTPVVSVLLADGRPTANSTTVTVRVTAYSPGAGVADMAFSGDGASFGPWERYTVMSTWTFAPGDGVKTLWVKVRSETGVESVPASSSIVLDTTPPAVVAISPVPNSTMAGLRPTFLVGFSEPIEPTSWMQLGLIVTDASGRVVAGSYAYDAPARTGRFIPDSNLTPGAPYFVTLGTPRDLAGNVVGSLGTWTVTTLIPTALSLAASARVVVPGASVNLSGLADVPSGAPVYLETRLGAETEPSSRITVQPQSGRFTITVTPAMNSSYQLTYPGSSIADAAQSQVATVLVRRLVELVRLSPTATRTVPAGRRITLTAQVTPTGGGARLSFRLYRFDLARRAYLYAGSYGRVTGTDGRATLTWTAKPGRWYWRVAVQSSLEYANNISPVYRWTVTGG